MNSPGPDRDSSSAGGASAPSQVFCILYGGVSYALVSTAAYAIWAYKLIENTGAMYAATAAVYIVFSGLALSRLVVEPAARKRFPFVLAGGFLLYAIGWCVFWFGLKGKFHADLWGSAAGLAAMTAIMRGAFGRTAGFLSLFGGLFLFHSLGYYLGDDLHRSVAGASGKLLWGAAHGLGFGAGLGYVLFQCQASPRNAVD